jgi:hypothetical protein
VHSVTKWILLAEDDPKDAQFTTRALAESKAPELSARQSSARCLTPLP